MDIEVDPDLFVKCRLCLEDKGVYQIVPAVQQQIKYCFDIEVEPYDGLPQLLCKECKTILTNYFTVKTNYINRQELLKSEKVSKSKAEKVSLETEHQQQEIVSSSQQIDCEVIHTNSDKPCEVINTNNDKTETKEIIFSCSETDHSDRTVIAQKSKKVLKKVKESKSWKNNYVKKFACRLCQKHFKKRSYVIKHASTHLKHYHKYKHILKRCCRVALNKIDDKPNLTGSTGSVVCDSRRIIKDEGYTHYNIVYLKNQFRSNSNTDVENNTRNLEPNNKTCNQVENGGDSAASSEEILKNVKPRKRIRLLSNSSEDEADEISNNNFSDLKKANKGKLDISKKKDKNNLSELDCINIDDTSSEAKSPQQYFMDAEKNEIIDKAIQSIASLSFNKYMKKIKSASNSGKTDINESQLKHKVLSLGRKILNSQGFTSPGLLRFLEYKNLEIDWIPSKYVSENNVVRIRTKLRGDESKELKWKKVDVREIDFEADEGSKSNSESADVTNDSTIDNQTTSMQCDSDLKPPESQKKVVVASDTNDSTLKNKILNIAPVANPKQLPKKVIAGASDSVSIGIYSETDYTKTNSSNSFHFDFNNKSLANQNCLPGMPIITSTTSLAQHDANKQTEPEKCMPIITSSISLAANKETQDKPSAGRIKVKPVSELLSDRAFSNFNQQSTFNTNSIWKVDDSQITDNGNINASGIISVNSSTLPVDQNCTSSSGTKSDYLILDTVELPNTKTSSPFDYFRDLLNIRGIQLLPTNSENIKDLNLHCLIKFKTVFTQEPLQGVDLRVSLFGLKNVFCFQVQDVNHRNITIKEISAHWEWEILKTFMSDISVKILATAQKISHEIYNNSNILLCLLKSIKHIKSS